MDKLELTLDKKNYVAGEQVYGSIYLIVKDAIKSDGVYLKLSGKEKCQWWERYQRSRTHGSGENQRVEYYYEYYKYGSKCPSYEYKFKIYEFPNGECPPGCWQLPFTFVLPSTITTSFDIEWDAYGDRENYAECKYEAKAYCEDKITDKKKKDTDKFYINQPPMQQSHGDKGDTNNEVKCYCCFPKGNVKVTGYSEKNCYMCGEQVYMVAEVENDMDNDCPEVYAVFERVLTMKGPHGKQKTFVHEEKGISGGSVKAKEKKKDQDAMRIQIGTGLSVGKKKKGKYANTQLYNTTCHGKVINCDYNIKARVKPDVCCLCEEEPHVKFPVVLVSPNLEPRVFKQPEGFCPVVCPMYVCQMTPEHATGKGPKYFDDKEEDDH